MHLVHLLHYCQALFSPGDFPLLNFLLPCMCIPLNTCTPVFSCAFEILILENLRINQKTPTKGQIKPYVDLRAVDSPKKRTN